ncbi:hypothetical protein AG1IA_01155 [Rhizoctonia solani AG-1 IA]|uniref:Uncharacterized protein n=1 Tax=Thanatephorus cucumeris (strain AG1-IA) TaxID=983506 RepID=L8X6U8_THACA|nr:hypothetical protein AG1IA_01155 [Rhizoctonia solani AG-1 IA]
MPDSTNNKHTPHPLANEESFEMDELNENSAPPSDKEEIMPKAVLEGEADDLSTWAWISAIWCVLTHYYTKTSLNDTIKVNRISCMSIVISTILIVSVDTTRWPGERGTDTLGTILIHPIRDWPPCSLLYSSHLSKSNPFAPPCRRNQRIRWLTKPPPSHPTHLWLYARRIPVVQQTG